jgi:uncharacterized protein (TIGR00304 family)
VHVRTEMMRQEIGLLLIAMGFLLAMTSLFPSLLQNTSSDNSGYGGVILIGPIPIVFGSSPEMAVLSMIVAAGLTVLVFLLFRRR